MPKFAFLFILAGAGLRLIMPIPNVSPIAAIALFAGAYLGRRWLAVLMPLAILFLSDLAIGLHNQMPAVYLSFALIALLSFDFLGKRNVQALSWRVGGASVASSLIFFVVTNFSVWLSGGMYAHNLTGFIECYTLALPFFTNTLLGDVAFTAAMFFAWEYLDKSTGQFAIRRLATQSARSRDVARNGIGE